jgi:DinB family protein
VIEPDPLVGARAYQASLLAELGDDDPAIVQAETPDLIRAFLAEAGSDARIAPEPGEWSVAGCIAHLTDGELVVSTRYRWILAEEQPPIVGYDQALWVANLRHAEDEPGDLLALFEALRTANLVLWERFGGTHGERIGLHSERGPESYDLTFRLAAGHDRVHMAQARRALDTVRLSRSRS